MSRLCMYSLDTCGPGFLMTYSWYPQNRAKAAMGSDTTKKRIIFFVIRHMRDRIVVFFCVTSSVCSMFSSVFVDVWPEMNEGVFLLFDTRI